VQKPNKRKAIVRKEELRSEWKAMGEDEVGKWVASRSALQEDHKQPKGKKRKLNVEESDGWVFS